MKQTLYHFTSSLHLPSILADRVLRPVESNVGSPHPDYPPYGLDIGPRVVWLMDVETTAGFDHGLGGSIADKTEIRFTVETGLAIKWTEWVPASLMHPEWRDGFVKRAGGPEAAEHWWVLPGRIPASRWTSVTNMKTGEEIDLP